MDRNVYRFKVKRDPHEATFTGTAYHTQLGQTVTVHTQTKNQLLSTVTPSCWASNNKLVFCGQG